MSDAAQQAAEIFKSRLGGRSVETALVLETGLTGLAEMRECGGNVPYVELPGFPQTPATHGGEVCIALAESETLLVLKGRADFHEIGDPTLMLGPIETLSLLGVRNILSIGFANSLNPQLAPGSIVAITDHIDFKGLNPLIGTGAGGYLNMNEVYDRRLLRKLRLTASGAGATLGEGVLAWISGPTYETPAEAKAARVLGADLVGMSIAPEAILAKRFGVPFASIAVVSDFAAGVSGGAPSRDLSGSTVVAALVELRRLMRAYFK
jgi:purine-nucleoside phosphorylase